MKHLKFFFFSYLIGILLTFLFNSYNCAYGVYAEHMDHLSSIGIWLKYSHLDEILTEIIGVSSLPFIVIELFYFFSKRK